MTLVVFSSEQWHQVHTVLRLRIGDSVRVFDGREPVDSVVELTGVAEGRVVDRQAQAAEPRTRFSRFTRGSLLQRDTFEPVLQWPTGDWRATHCAAADRAGHCP